MQAPEGVWCGCVRGCGCLCWGVCLGVGVGLGVGEPAGDDGLIAVGAAEAEADGVAVRLSQPATAMVRTRASVTEATRLTPVMRTPGA